VTFWPLVTFAVERKDVKNTRDEFLLGVLFDTRETVAPNVFDSIRQRRIYRKISRDPQSEA
jgi:hypothetical protein